MRLTKMIMDALNTIIDAAEDELVSLNMTDDEECEEIAEDIIEAIAIVKQFMKGTP